MGGYGDAFGFHARLNDLEQVGGGWAAIWTKRADQVLVGLAGAPRQFAEADSRIDILPQQEPPLVQFTGEEGVDGVLEHLSRHAGVATHHGFHAVLVGRGWHGASVRLVARLRQPGTQKVFCVVVVVALWSLGVAVEQNQQCLTLQNANHRGEIYPYLTLDLTPLICLGGTFECR